jgi:hypothetical protein
MKVDRKKPLMAMEPAEFEAAMDQVGMSNTIAMLNDGRSGGLPLKLAVCYLTPAGETTERVVSFGAEYGDGEGIRMESNFIDEVTRIGALLPGEKLILRVVEVTYWKELMPE